MYKDKLTLMLFYACEADYRLILGGENSSFTATSKKLEL